MLRNDEGQGLVEYALNALISIIAIVALQYLGGKSKQHAHQRGKQLLVAVSGLAASPLR